MQVNSFAQNPYTFKSAVENKNCPSKFRDKPEGCERNLGVATLKSEHVAGGVDTAKFRTAEKPESEQKKPTSAKHWKAYSVSEKEFKEAAECETRLDVKKDENPISAAGEKATLAKATFVAGIGLGGRLLFELVDGGFVLDSVCDKAKKITDKQKNLTKNERMFKELGVGAGLVAAFVCSVAALYTVFKAPEINYKGNINTVKHRKDMDVYIKSNAVEKELYTQMNDKAKNADEKEKIKLREQYMQMQAAKNKVPDFVK